MTNEEGESSKKLSAAIERLTKLGLKVTDETYKGTRRHRFLISADEKRFRQRSLRAAPCGIITYAARRR
jgi:muramoyltetrapeptide carboxypeptidase LdcA involved in peptidoglycan recycling